jgi:hypothetical protein
MGNPRPKKQRADYKGMNIEKLFSLLEQRHQNFSMNLIHQGQGVPVMMNWQHRDPALQQWEQRGFHLKTGTYRDLRGGLTAILERKDAYDEFVEEQKKLAKKNDRKRQLPMLEGSKVIKVNEPGKEEDEEGAYEKEMASRAAVQRAILNVIAPEPLEVKGTMPLEVKGTMLKQDGSQKGVIC